MKIGQCYKKIYLQIQNVNFEVNNINSAIAPLEIEFWVEYKY